MEIVGQYIDRAFSAKTDDRPDFQRMIADSAKKLFDVVLVWKLDRFARNRYDSAFYRYTLRKNGVRVVSAKENISNGPEGYTCNFSRSLPVIFGKPPTMIRSINS